MSAVTTTAAVPSAQTAISQTNNPAGAAVSAALIRQTEAWNRNDAVAFAQDFAEDASFVSVRGDMVHGLEAIVRNHAFIFAGPYKATHLDATVEGITYPAVSVAIVDTVMTVSGFKGLPPGLVATEPDKLRTRMKFIFVESGGEWKIVAGQNTAVSPATMTVK